MKRRPAFMMQDAKRSKKIGLFPGIKRELNVRFLNPLGGECTKQF